MQKAMKFLLTLAFSAIAAYAQLAPAINGVPQYFDNSGVPLAGGLLYTYSAGTSTPISTFDQSGFAHTNPIVLDAAGRVPGGIFFQSSSVYKFILQTSAGVTLWTLDDLSAVPGGSSNAALWTAVGNTISNTNTGNVGIGSVLPLSKLSVVGASIGTNYLLRLDDTANTPGIGFYSSGNLSGNIYANSAGFHIVGPSLTENVTISAAGNTGFLNTSPAYPVDTGAGDAQVGQLRITNEGSGHQIVIDSFGNGFFNNMTIVGTCTGCGGGGGGSLPVVDTTAIVYNTADHTKLMQFSAANVPTATTVVLTIPSSSVTLVGEENAETISGLKTFSGVITGTGGMTMSGGNIILTGTGNFNNGGVAGPLHYTFQNSDSSFLVDNMGNINSIGKVAADYFSPAVDASPPATGPGAGHGGWSYVGGTLWRYYNTTSSAWATIDLAAVAGGVSAVNGFTGSVNILGTASEVIIANASNNVTLSLPQAIATTSTPKFGALAIGAGASVIGGSITVDTGGNVILAGGHFNAANTSGNIFQSASGSFAVDYNGNVAGQNSNFNQYQIQGATFVTYNSSPAGANGTFYNLTVTGTCTGCGGGGGGGVTSLTATANQTTVSAATGAVTVGTVQNIGVSSAPTFNGLTINGGGTATFNANIAVSSGNSINVSGSGGNVNIANGHFNASAGSGTIFQSSSGSFEVLYNGDVESQNYGGNNYYLGPTPAAGGSVLALSGTSNTNSSVAVRHHNAYNSSGVFYSGQDYTISFDATNSKLTVNGTDVTSIQFVGGVLVSFSF